MEDIKNNLDEVRDALVAELKRNNVEVSEDASIFACINGIDEIAEKCTGDATAVASDIVTGKTAMVKGKIIAGAIAISTPSKSGNVVTVKKGIISADTSVTVGTKLAAKTYTPGTTNQTIAADTYLSGAQTIKGDANLVAGNIRSGKTIFNVSGTFANDGDAVAGNILNGKTAYVKGSKVTGTIKTVTATVTDGVVTVPVGNIATKQTFPIFDMYECSSVDATNGKWSGYGIIYQNGTLSKVGNVTNGLSFSGTTPSVGKYYTKDASYQLIIN